MRYLLGGILNILGCVFIIVAALSLVTFCSGIVQFDNSEYKLEWFVVVYELIRIALRFGMAFLMFRLASRVNSKNKNSTYVQDGSDDILDENL